MDDNASITASMKEASLMLSTILLIQPRSSAGRGKSREQMIMEYAKDIQQKLPDNFDFAAAQKGLQTGETSWVRILKEL